MGKPKPSCPRFEGIGCPGFREETGIPRDLLPSLQVQEFLQVYLSQEAPLGPIPLDFPVLKSECYWFRPCSVLTKILMRGAWLNEDAPEMAADVVTMVILLLLSLSFLWAHTLDMSDVDTQLSELRSHVNTLEFASKVYSLIIDTFDCPAPSREDPPGPHCSVLLGPCASNTLVRNSS